MPDTDEQVRTIQEYLDRLNEELAGSDPALIQDALYAAENYLRNATSGAAARSSSASSTSETAPAFSSFRNFRSSALSVSMVAPLPFRECRSPGTGDSKPRFPAMAFPSL